MVRNHFLWLAAMLSCLPLPAGAQDNYEIQVYGADTVEPRSTMVEFHSNFTIAGSKTIADGVRPTNHAFHETLEITHGWTPWFETGYYVLSSSQQASWQYGGS